MRSIWTKSATIEAVDRRCCCTAASVFDVCAAAGTATAMLAASGASAQAAVRISARREIVRVILLSFLVMMARPSHRSEEHTSELQSLMRISYAVFCFKKKQIVSAHD